MYYNVHTHSQSASQNVIPIVSVSLTEKIPQSNYVSIGIPPWESNKCVSKDILTLATYATKKAVVAIGEVGVDKRLNIALMQQLMVLEQQIELAASINKPLIIHCVGYFNELVQLIKKKRIKVDIIIHGFRGKPELANELIRHGCYLSLGEKSLMHPETIHRMPLDKIFAETDTSEKTIEEIYQTIALIKEIPLETLKKSIEQNITQCFRWNLYQ